MEAQSEPTPRVRCMRCMRPARVCYCAHVTEVPTATRVVILQHPRERDMPIGTAHMATLCLPNSELHVGVDWDGSAALAKALADATLPAVLLYPGEGARDLAQDPLPGPCTLVVLDGTWWQARKLLRQSQRLAALPRVAFVPDKPSEYRIRREPQDTYVSTIEALCTVLPLLEQKPRALFEPLLVPFRAMVDKQIECERTLPNNHGGAARRRLKLRKNARAKLREQQDDLVCVMIEASAWARRHRALDAPIPPADELVYFAAHRLRTGETLATAVRPRHGLAPRTLSQTELTAETLHAAVDHDELARRTRAFFREQDVLCTWGDHALRLAADFLPALPHFDARQLCRDRAQGKVGSLEALLDARGLAMPAPLAEGRAGRRLAELVCAVRDLCDAR